MRTITFALALTFISLGAVETKAEVNTIKNNYSANYSSRFYAKRSIRTAKISILRAKRVIGNWGWSPYRADLAEAIRHQQYAIDLYRWGDFYEAARNSDYAGRIAEYILFEAFDNGYCSYNDYYTNNNSTWFWGGNNGWGFGFSQQNNEFGNNNGFGNNGGFDNNNGFDNNGGFDNGYYKKDNTYNGPRKRGSTENAPNQNSSNNPRYNGTPSKPTFDQSPRGQQPNFDNNRINAPKQTSPQQSGSMERVKPSETQKEEMKQAFEKIKMDKPDDSKMKMKSKSDDEVLKSTEKLDIDL